MRTDRIEHRRDARRGCWRALSAFALIASIAAAEDPPPPDLIESLDAALAAFLATASVDADVGTADGMAATRAAALGITRLTPFSSSAWSPRIAPFAEDGPVEECPEPRTSLLQARLRSGVRVVATAPELVFDAPLTLNGIADCTLDLSRPRIVAGDVGERLALVRIDACRRVVVRGLRAGDADAIAVEVDGGEDIRIVGCECRRMRGGVALAGACRRVVVAGLACDACTRAGALVVGACEDVLIDGARIADGTGTSDFAAGIVVSDRACAPSQVPDSDGRAPTRAGPRPAPPRRVLVVGSRVERMRAAGIYLDGACACAIVGDDLVGNAKEGLCLDFSSCGDLVAWNRIVGNGRRWGQDDATLARDSVLAWGRLADGSSAAKLPGVSIDTAADDAVFGNLVARNDGSGIKAVRSAVACTIACNAVVDNNVGRSDRGHFFGVELGDAPLDRPADDVDGAGSRGVDVVDNVIAGEHYAGVFLARRSTGNRIAGNRIAAGAVSRWSIESAAAGEQRLGDNAVALPARDRRLDALRSRLVGASSPFAAVAAAVLLLELRLRRARARRA